MIHADIILVRPSTPQNIGSVARAMKTMGFKQLVLINPQCDHRCDKALWMAHHAEEILHHAKVAEDITSELSHYDLTIGTTTRNRAKERPIISSRDLYGFLAERSIHLRHIGVVFGAEETGLSNEELAACHVVSSIPMTVAQPSLNLSQAVMVYCYSLGELCTCSPEPVGKTNSVNTEVLATLHHRIRELVRIGGFDSDSPLEKGLVEGVAHVPPRYIQQLLAVTKGLLQKLTR